MNKPVSKMTEPLSEQIVAAIAQRVASLRKDQQLSLDQLAARAGVSNGLFFARKIPWAQPSAPTTMGEALDVPLNTSVYQRFLSVPPWRSP